jgi:hypothetical protein
MALDPGEAAVLFIRRSEMQPEHYFLAVRRSGKPSFDQQHDLQIGAFQILVAERRECSDLQSTLAEVISALTNILTEPRSPALAREEKHLVRFTYLDRAPCSISRKEVEPKTFQSIGLAVSYARKEATSSTRVVEIDVVEKRTRQTKLRLKADGDGHFAEHLP